MRKSAFACPDAGAAGCTLTDFPMSDRTSRAFHLPVVAGLLLAMISATSSSSEAAVTLDPIEGIVTDAHGNPIEGATVEFAVREYDPAAVRVRRVLSVSTSGRDGTFHFDGLPTSEKGTQYEVWATADGYAFDHASVQERGNHPKRFLNYRSLQRTEKADLVLPRSGTLRGSVTDKSGRPIADVLVRALYDLDPVRTDTAGKFVVEKVAQHPDGTGRIPFNLSVFHPDYVGLAGSGETWDNFEIRPIALLKGIRVEGRVVDKENGQGIKGFLVRASANYHPQFAAFGCRFNAELVTDASGEFALCAPPGELTVSARRNQYGNTDWPKYVRSASALVLIEEDSPSRRIELAFERGRVLRGKVVDAAGQPVEGVRLTLRSRTPRADGRSEWYGESDSEGNFEINGLMEGVYDLAPDREAYGMSFQTVRVSLNETQDPQDLLIHFNPATPKSVAFLRGKVLLPDGSPAPHAQIEIKSTFPKGPLPRGGIEDFQTSCLATWTGEFEAEVQGDYGPLTLRAWDSYRILGATLNIADPARSREPIVLTLQRGAEFSGTIAYADGKPYPGASVSVSETIQTGPGSFIHSSVVSCHSDLQGKYLLTGYVPSGLEQDTVLRAMYSIGLTSREPEQWKDVAVAAYPVKFVKPGDRREGLNFRISRDTDGELRLAAPSLMN